LDQNSETGKGGLAKIGFKKVLNDIKEKTLTEQKAEFEEYLEKCLSSVEQRDDITIIAFKL
jgi:hypothetical protein